MEKTTETWVDGEGRVWSIARMTDEHLNNVITWVCRNARDDEYFANKAYQCAREIQRRRLTGTYQPREVKVKKIDITDECKLVKTPQNWGRDATFIIQHEVEGSLPQLKFNNGTYEVKNMRILMNFPDKPILVGDKVLVSGHQDSARVLSIHNGIAFVVYREGKGGEYHELCEVSNLMRCR